MEFYSSIRRNETLVFAGKWIELENIILSEVSQAQEAKDCMFSHMWNIGPTKIQEIFDKQVTLRGDH
jgi:hypothetical protein